MPTIEELDINMREDSIEDISKFTWYNPMQTPFSIAGFPFLSENQCYNRFPLSSLAEISNENPNLESLSWNTAGGQIHFCTDATEIALNVKLRNKADMCHMPASGQCGFDCYLQYNDAPYTFAGIGKFNCQKDKYACIVAEKLGTQTKNILLNMPLYAGVLNVEIGLPNGASLCGSQPFVNKKPIVVYGTSITQGGCASRPGMCYTNILSRQLSRQFINYGFCGNGLGELSVCKILPEINNPAMLIIDYDANAGVFGRLPETLNSLIDLYRAKHLRVPILILSRCQAPEFDRCPTMMKDIDERRKYQYDCVKNRNANGDDNIYFYDGFSLWDNDYAEYTVDGIHPNDLGFYKMANVLKNILCEILQK